MTVCVIGEGMLELSRDGDGGGWRLGHGGDTLNTAIHMARAGRDVAYLSALGDDDFSRDLRSAWAAEGVDTGAILTAPDRHCGLYAIHLDEAGERSFTYWRGDSAARDMFDLPDAGRLLARAAGADLVLYSLITLAILPPPARRRLFELCDEVRRRGGRVAFDGNYRPRLWADPAEARRARDTALGRCDVGLPTLGDEISLGAPDDPEETARRWRAAGTGEVVVKLGAGGCLVDGDLLVPPPAKVAVADASGAGDAFNAGYLGARLDGAPPERAAAAGHALAAWVIGRPGAIPAVDAAAPYRKPPLTSSAEAG